VLGFMYDWRVVGKLVALVLGFVCAVIGLLAVGWYLKSLPTHPAPSRRRPSKRFASAFTGPRFCT